MLKDPGSRYNIGFGIPPQQYDQEEGVSADASFVQKAMRDHPVMRFFAIGTASLVGMHVAGKVSRGIGVRLAYKMQEVARGTDGLAPIAQKAIKDIRDLREYLDQFDATHRTRVDPTDRNILVKKVGKRYETDTVERLDDFFQRTERVNAGENVANWTVRDTIQQRLVAQARRLPYELPAFYAVDKALINPLLDEDDRKPPVKWYNPFDVVGDFAYSSLKMTAFNAVPFELGLGAVSGKYNIMAGKAAGFYRDSGGQRSTNSLGMLSLQSILGQVGADVGDITNNILRFSNQTTGAMGAFVTESLHSSLTYKQWLERMNARATQSTANPSSRYARRMYEAAKQNKKDIVIDSMDVMPGPFKGIASGIVAAKRSFKDIGKAYDDWQSVLSGRSKLSDYTGEDLIRLKDYMRRGGQTRIEEFASQIYTLGGGGRFRPNGTNNPNWKKGLFYQDRRQDIYNDILVENLSSFFERAGLEKTEAIKRASLFVRSSSVISPFSGANKNIPGNGIVERIVFGQEKYNGPVSKDQWWDWVTRKAGKAKIDLNVIARSDFERAVRASDVVFGSASFKRSMDNTIEQQWNYIHNRLIPRFGGDILSTSRRPYEEFAGGLNKTQKDFLLRRTAQKMGIKITDPTGNKLPENDIKNALRGRGMDPDKVYRMRGYLMSQGVIAKPWSIDANNIFGIRQMTISEADRSGYFKANTPEVQKEINFILNSKKFGYDIPDTSKALGMKGLYRLPNGQVLDTGRIGRSFTRFMDRAAEEFQVPLIHIKPLHLLGYGAEQGLRRKAVMQYASGNSLQPHLNRTDTPNPDFYMWMKTSARGSKGRVVGLSTPDLGPGPDVFEYTGSYKPFSTDAYNLLSRHLRIANREIGIPTSQKQEKKWRKIFDVSHDQSESLFGLAGRWWEQIRGKVGSSRNALSFAQRWADPTTPFSSFGEADAVGFTRLKQMLRSYGFTRNVIHKLMESPGGQKYRDAFKLEINGTPTSILDIPSSALPDAVEHTLNRDLKLAPSDEVRSSLRRIQQNLMNILKSSKQETQYFDSTTPQAMRQAGVSRRIEEFKYELYKYQAMKGNITGSQGGTFGQWSADLLGDLEGLVRSGSISRSELSEARAAVLGVQLEFLGSGAYTSLVGQAGSYGVFNRPLLKKTMQSLLEGDPNTAAEARRTLSEIGSNGLTSRGKFSSIRRLLAGVTRTTPYEQADSWNPFGTKNVFVPTIGTALNRVGSLRALASATGLTTWSDPEAFSATGVIPSHLGYRLNRYFETFSLGIDPTRYRGPLDYYARGMVGKRVLPIVAAGTTATMIDRQLGGMVNKDEQGNPIYSPLIMGYGADVIAGAQVGLAGLVPGGQTAEEKRDELLYGEVPIRSGRYWPLGNCVLPTQLIQTGYGEYKEAQSIEIDDVVITHEGVLQPVLDVIIRDMRPDEWTPEIELYTIPITNITTDNHPYLAVKQKRCPSSSFVDCRPDRKATSCKNHQYKLCDSQSEWNPQWIEAQYLEEGDYLAYPRIKFDTIHNEIDNIPADFDFGYVIGLYLAEGNIHSFKLGRARGLEFSLNASETNLVEILDLFFDKYFNITGQVIQRSNNGIKVRYFSTLAAELFHSLLYEDGKKKFISDIYNYSEEFAKGILSGYFDGDGHFDFKNKSLKIEVTSARLEYLLQVRNLLFTFGIANSIWRHDERDFIGWRLGTSGDAAVTLNDLLLLYKTKDLDVDRNVIVSKYIVFDEEYAFIKIKSIKDSGYHGVVYDFEINESHSFCSVISIMHNTPFKGGRIQYFRPSWYQRFKSGAAYMPEKNESPLERLAFGFDFSPLRPFDPYRFERQNYESRPYPVTGDYFTGPWGPLNPALNATAGRILKPRRKMHEEEMKYAMQQYVPVGESGAYLSTSRITGVPDRYSRSLGSAADSMNSFLGGIAGSPGVGSGGFYGAMGYAPGTGRASGIVRGNANLFASQYSAMAGGSSPVPFGVPTAPGRMPQRVQTAIPAINPGSNQYQASNLVYRTQELMGIYGFMAASTRESLGLGTKDLTPAAAIYEPASRGYSSSRTFWNMNFGGIGDLPLPVEGNFANLEISEIIRRFVPKEPSGISYINPLPNTLGQQYPWLPGINYPINPLKTGDPYNMPDADIRLPGTGYARTHQLFPDQYGSLGLTNIHDILADVAPWSEEYKAVDRMVGRGRSPLEQRKIDQTRAQIEAMRIKNEFTPYEYKYLDPLGVAEHPAKFALGRAWEWLAHRDTYVNTKFLPTRTVVEDWERDNVYGATFPTWENPIESFLKPAIYRSSQRNPLISAAALGATGFLFGTTAESRKLGALIGMTLGGAVSGGHYVNQKLTGERYLPATRRKELALEEYIDMLSYTRSAVLSTRAAQQGNMDAANYFFEESKRTMYGVDLNTTPEQISMSIPKRKREHFRAMLYAPEEEREQILSTAGRLERRIYEAAWGMPVEERPDIVDYFKDHEIPSLGSEFWSPLVNMDTIKIKVGQSLGLDMSQMGFYPQQIKEANLINPSYPQMFSSNSRESVEAQLRRLMYDSGYSGRVRTIPTPYSGTNVELIAGV